MNAVRTTSAAFALHCLPRNKQTLNLKKVTVVGAVQLYTTYLNPSIATFLQKNKVQTSFCGHSRSYSINTRGSFLGRKVAWA